MLDWCATREDVYEEIEPLRRAEERALLPKLNELPDDAAEAVAAIDRALVSSGRRLVHTESLGDLSIVILVPEAVHAGFLERVGPWRIAAG